MAWATASKSSQGYDRPPNLPQKLVCCRISSPFSNYFAFVVSIISKRCSSYRRSRSPEYHTLSLPGRNISSKRAELAKYPARHPAPFHAIFDLAWALCERFLKESKIDDLNEAIVWHRTASELRSVKSNAYDEQGVVNDLEEAITHGRTALELRPPGHPYRGVSLYNLACNLRTRFVGQAKIRDLQEAIELYRAALELHPSGNPRRLLSLQNLALCLADRYDNPGVVADSKKATKLDRAVGTLRPAGCLDRDATDLDEAIALEQEVLQLLTPGDPRSQVVTLSLNASPVTHFDIKQVIRNVAIETLKTMPIRSAAYPYWHPVQPGCATIAFYGQSHRVKLIRAEVSRYLRFVMLSHRWGEGEPSLRDIESRSIYGLSIKRGFGKLQTFCLVALERDYLWAWSDTCCIDKDSSAELQEAIGSMFVWYQRSALTIVYLPDVPSTSSFESSEWFRTNLTSSNHKTNAAVLEELERATGIESQFLTSFSSGMDEARSRLQWASLRRTTRPEDIAYSLFGIFNIHLPVLYGEFAENALGRLLAEIISQSGDISVLDWVGEASRYHSCFPADISSYQTLPLSSPQPNSEDYTSIMSEQPTVSSALRMLHRSLDKLPLPRFLNRRLTLPCITYVVTAVQLKEAPLFLSKYTYEIQATGLRPLEVTLPWNLKKETMSQGALQLVRPWHSKLLGPSPGLKYATIEEQLLFTLERPFNALLLTELPHNEYKRIASSTSIIAQPVDVASILQSEG
ncbi:hypothetical protein EDC04DRAFT_3151071 [Pisolithus marmoratus]|nr:hypothetical protein EDC04DRAFT_3151071 [Pisolithus marmoratus]